jgi:hypothetical protein
MCGGISRPAKGGIMNPQIIKLGLESGMLNYVDHETPRHYFLSAHADEECLERFAELIVRECAKSADEWYQAHNDIHWDPAQHVKNHFGMKE